MNATQDSIFATILEMFGDQFTIAKILETCQNNGFDLQASIEELINVDQTAEEVASEDYLATKDSTDNAPPLLNGHEEVAVERPAEEPKGRERYNLTTLKFAVMEDQSKGAIRKIRPNDERSASPALKYKPENFDRIVGLVQDGYKVLVLCRGVPGSGKSTLARAVVDSAMKGASYRNHIISADDYFVNVNGKYEYDVSRLKEAHDYAHKTAHKKMRDGWSPIIIDNTNCQLWEMEPYCRFAAQTGYLIELLEPATPWAFRPGLLAKKNQHNVSKDKIQRKIDSYEAATVVRLLDYFRMSEHSSLVPQFRHMPPFEKDFIAQRSLELIPEITQQQADGEKEKTTPMDEEDAQPSTSMSDEPKPPRNATPSYSLDPQAKPFDYWSGVDWTAHEDDNFWEKTAVPVKETPKETATPPSSLSWQPKPKRESTMPPESPSRTIEKHRKDCPNENEQFKLVRQIYPFVALDHLFDLFHKCGGDANWTMDLLLADNKTQEFVIDSGTPNDFVCSCGVEEDVPKSSNRGEKQQVNAGASSSKSRRLAPHKLNLKQKIEKSVQIGDEHFPDHTKKIRAVRRKHWPDAPPPPEPVEAAPEEETPEDPSSSPEVDDQMLEIELGEALVKQLDALFGMSAFQQTLDPEKVKIKPSVFMTRSFAAQLHALWVESVHNQVEEQRHRSLKDDEDLARTLHVQQNYPELLRDSAPTDLAEIMQMELALARYRADVAEWRQPAAEQTLADRLKRDKLRAVFPEIDDALMDELLAAHGNKFEETVEILRNTLSLSREKELQLDSKELFDAAAREMQKIAQEAAAPSDEKEKYSDPKLAPEDIRREALRDFEEFRNLAQHHAQLRAECLGKARNAYNRRQAGVAYYYTQVAELHRSKMDGYNHRAANCMVEVHNVSQSNENMLDLHYLHSTEAIQCLDLFIDKHLQRLRAGKKPYIHVFVITGRGKNSMNGIPAIKIRVKSRLKERNLRFCEVNPGLLKVKIFSTTHFA